MRGKMSFRSLWRHSKNIFEKQMENELAGYRRYDKHKRSALCLSSAGNKID